MQHIFSCVLTDNDSEFANEARLAYVFGEQTPKRVCFSVTVGSLKQKGACEKNHVEIRKLLPKGHDIRFDRLTRQDSTLLMSKVNFKPGGSRAWMRPCEVFVSALGIDLQKLVEALDIEKLSQKGLLTLTPHRLEQARTQRDELLLTQVELTTETRRPHPLH